MPLALFRAPTSIPLPPNRLVIQIQPNEGMTLDFSVKTPGPELETTPVEMDFRYGERFDLGHQTGYETLLYDVLIGDQTLFQRADQIEGGWRAVQPLIDAWRRASPSTTRRAPPGPKGADDLLARDGRDGTRSDEPPAHQAPGVGHRRHAGAQGQKPRPSRPSPPSRACARRACGSASSARAR